MNKKIALLAGVAALAFNVHAIVVPVPASGAIVNQHLTQHDKQVEQAHAQEDSANNVSVLWYIACVIGLLGIAEAIDILIDR